MSQSPHTTIAGHTCHEASYGRVCRYCERRWVDIASATATDLGKHGISHVGHLIETELAQITAERDRIWSAVLEGSGI